MNTRVLPGSPSTALVRCNFGIPSLSIFCLLLTSDALACATCFGTPQDAQTQGMNAAIFTLLGVTATVLSVAGGFGAMILLRMRSGQ